jgi:hypothetical protein
VFFCTKDCTGVLEELMHHPTRKIRDHLQKTTSLCIASDNSFKDIIYARSVSFPILCLYGAAASNTCLMVEINHDLIN